MKRAVRGLLAALLITTLAGIFTSSPASADLGHVCVGQGTANTPPLVYPGVSLTPANGAFSLTLPAPACVNVTATTVTGLNASGTLTGWCGRSIGSGTLNGHAFVYTSVGSMLVITATVGVGVANAVPDVTATPMQSCLSGATKFLVTGAVAVAL